MNAHNGISISGSWKVAALVIGLAVATSAQAGGGSGQCKVTHAPTPYVTSQPASPAKVQPTVSQPALPEIQVNVMARGEMQQNARRSVYIHR